MRFVYNCAAVNRNVAGKYGSGKTFIFPPVFTITRCGAAAPMIAELEMIEYYLTVIPFTVVSSAVAYVYSGVFVVTGITAAADKGAG